MKVRDLLDRIKFACASPSDLAGKSVHPLFSNKNITQQLKFALDRYANFTKAFEDYYSWCVSPTTPAVEAPKDILRTGGLRFLVWYINGYAYPLNAASVNTTFGNYPVSLQGLPKWFLYWKDRINFFPQNSNGFQKTVLTAPLDFHGDVIKVESTNGFPQFHGRIQTDCEVIEYERKTETTFEGLKRGQNDTKRCRHNAGAMLIEHNVVAYYYRLHWGIDVNEDDVIDDLTLNREMMVSDDHLEIIADYTTFRLLQKIDAQRAAAYKVNFDEWLPQAKYEISKGRSDVTNMSEIRPAYTFENSLAFWSEF